VVAVAVALKVVEEAVGQSVALEAVVALPNQSQIQMAPRTRKQQRDGTPLQRLQLLKLSEAGTRTRQMGIVPLPVTGRTILERIHWDRYRLMSPSQRQEPLQLRRNLVDGLDYLQNHHQHPRRPPPHRLQRHNLTRMLVKTNLLPKKMLLQSQLYLLRSRLHPAKVVQANCLLRRILTQEKSWHRQEMNLQRRIWRNYPTPLIHHKAPPL
jgi:hypothetical protein